MSKTQSFTLKPYVLGTGQQRFSEKIELLEKITGIDSGKEILVWKLLDTWKPCQLKHGIGMAIEIERYLSFATDNYMPKDCT